MRRAFAGATIAAAGAAALILARRSSGRAGLRLRRGIAALRLAARGGARYASNAPRLFAAAFVLGKHPVLYIRHG